MKTIKILGTGCPNCLKTIENTKKAIEESGQKIDLVKVEDIVDIMQYDILSTPGVVIGEDLKIAGRVPTIEEIKKLLL